jgi:hypothetical protein
VCRCLPIPPNFFLTIICFLLSFVILAYAYSPILSRHDWDKHEPQMYANVKDISDEDLTSFTGSDLVAVRTASTSYGTLIFGKIQLKKAGKDAYLHVRIHDPPDQEQSGKDVLFHSIHTLEGGKTTEDDRPTFYRAIMTQEDPIEFFHE